ERPVYVRDPNTAAPSVEKEGKKGESEVRTGGVHIILEADIPVPVTPRVSDPIEKPEKPEKAPDPKTVPIPKEIDVDGVRFSSDESLTSLDAKVGKGKKVSVQEGPDVVEVGLDSTRTPISEKQFVSDFLSKIKGSG
ncbi:hypothetical protein LCGC14_1606130, partial [marine sediment metagenome]